MPKQNLQQGKRWYVLHTYSGYEENVSRNLKQRIESMDMEDRIFDTRKLRSNRAFSEQATRLRLAGMGLRGMVERVFQHPGRAVSARFSIFEGSFRLADSSDVYQRQRKPHATKPFRHYSGTTYKLSETASAGRAVGGGRQ